MAELPRFRARRFSPYAPSPHERQRLITRFGVDSDIDVVEDEQETDVDDENSRPDSITLGPILFGEAQQPPLQHREEGAEPEDPDQSNREEDGTSNLEDPRYRESPSQSSLSNDAPPDLVSEVNSEVERIMVELHAIHNTANEQILAEAISLKTQDSKNVSENSDNGSSEAKDSFDLRMKTILESKKTEVLSSSREAIKTFVEDLLRRHQRELDEIKGKQWCQSCRSESIYQCCWNVSYCSKECQHADWSQHKQFCVRPKKEFANEFIRQTYFTKYDKFDDDVQPQPPRPRMFPRQFF